MITSQYTFIQKPPGEHEIQVNLYVSTFTSYNLI